MTAPATISVLGLGNVLLGDDGFGPYMVELLCSQYQLPENVTAIDVGTPGLYLSEHLSASEAVIVIDAVSAAGEPGELRFYRREDLDRLPLLPRVSPHDPALPDALWRLDLTGTTPREFLLVGAIPERLTLGTGLSERVRGACAAAMGAVLQELARLGAPARERETMQPSNVWWAGD